MSNSTDDLVKAWLLYKFKKQQNEYFVRLAHVEERKLAYEEWKIGQGWQEGPGYRSIELGQSPPYVPPRPVAPVHAHFLACKPEVLHADGEWCCDCYSEYTRGDRYVLNAVLECACGEIQAPFYYGIYDDLPAFIEELDSFQNFDCAYDEDD
jgi:hypothetical protein